MKKNDPHDAFQKKRIVQAGNLRSKLKKNAIKNEITRRFSAYSPDAALRFRLFTSPNSSDAPETLSIDL